MSSAQVDASRANEVIRGFLDHGSFCRESLSIRDKRGISVPLELTPAQVKLSNLVHQQQRRGLPVRIRCLKARQVHMSVGIATHIWKACAFLRGQKGMVWAHVGASTIELFDYYKQFENQFEPFRGLRKLPRTAMKDGEEIEYEGGGKITFHTAGGQGGRSGSYKFLHLSETAFPNWSSTIRTGLLGSVPDLADTMVFDESTANGMGGDFYEAWKSAEDPNNRSGWLSMFFGWHEHPEYVQTLDADQAGRLQQSYTDEELDLITRFHLRPEQIAWRRWKIGTDMEGDVRRFRQEYPINPEEAFLTSGRPRLDMVCVNRQPVDQQPSGGELRMERIGLREQVVYQPSRDGSGTLKVYRRPVPGHRYVIGADVAEGIDAKEGKGTADPDYSVAQVLEVGTGEQVAVLRARMEPVPFAEYVWTLMQWYNHAYLAPEANGPGVAFIGELLQLEVPQSLIYQRRRDPSDRRPLMLQDLGFRTLSTTKADLISKLDRALLEGGITLYDPATVHELRVFVYWPNGSVAAQRGEHDDCVIALALAVMGLITLPPAEIAKPGGNYTGVSTYGRKRKLDSGWDD